MLNPKQGCKPHSGEIDVHLMEQRPTYRAGYALDITLEPMELEPKSLGVPLYRRNWSGVWFVLASMGCAWLWHKPTDVLGIAISCLVGGITFWLALGPGLNFLKHHQSPAIRLVAFFAAVGGVAFVMQTAIPFLNSYVGSRL